jgi:hypothetical protein
MRLKILPATLTFLPLFFLPGLACGQCLGSPEGQGISLEAHNPFEADFSTTLTPPASSKLVSASVNRPQSVARDSEGRVRVDRFLGKYEMKPPGGEVTQVERYHIAICDPVSEKSMQLDTATKTATVTPFYHSPVPAVPAASEVSQSFCSLYFGQPHHFQQTHPEDLGRRTIEGFDAQGVRVTTTVILSRQGERTEATSYAEDWCSDELGAVLLQVFEPLGPHGHKREVALSNIVRREPDPALFQIPDDYTIVEHQTGPLRPAPVSSVPPAAAPGKPQ